MLTYRDAPGAPIKETIHGLDRVVSTKCKPCYQKSLIRGKSGIRLDIACGANKQGPGWVGMDIRPLEGVDVVHDALSFPWPFEDGSVLCAVCSHYVEHIPPTAIDNGKTRFPFFEFMDECWRVLKPEGELAIVMPHGHSEGYLQDPTHVNCRNENTWRYFDPEDISGLYNVYQPKPWKVKYLVWNPSTNMEVILTKRAVSNG